ncbi:hypothetical protein MZO42_11605 [Sphingomonas psychrotolerans]|uniref:Uncharacterized protein n=1 Tax=Sphingomonas psychrotolerans TaxID=1327635 RepID=A0ABU3N482_9SPHN|nr:hypothetical protein [Sphingomonas psychrotolerans]MDT8759344.1 hypothetical protein [Sphingomonas psychrotolerans]
MRFSWLLALAGFSAGVPLLPQRTAPPPALVPWPTRYEGHPLQRLAAGPGDALLARDFPGHVARFGDGRRQIVLRQVARATRLLHPPRDCFAALGYAITPLPMRRVAGGRASCFEARRNGTRLTICEHIRAADGAVFPDVPSWYWPALTGASPGPWLGVMTVERTG